MYAHCINITILYLEFDKAASSRLPSIYNSQILPPPKSQGVEKFSDGRRLLYKYNCSLYCRDLNRDLKQIKQRSRHQEATGKTERVPFLS